MLTDAHFRNLKPGDKDVRLADGGGLYLFVTTKGYRSWRLKYRFAGKEQRLMIGSYPETSVKEARAKRDEVRAAIRTGRDPKASTAHAAAGSVGGPTFEQVARDWFGRQKKRWKPIHAADVIGSFEKDLFPSIGAVPIGDVDAPTLLAALRLVEGRGAIETAARIRQRASKVFRYHAVVSGIARTDPAANLSDGLEPVPPKKEWPAMVVLEDLHDLVAKVDVATASPVTRLGSRFLALTAQRPAMVRGMRWDEVTGVDWNDPSASAPAALWRVPAGRMKLKLVHAGDAAYDHRVPLSRQAVETLRTVRSLTGRGPLVFCSSRSSEDPMSENAIGYLYNRLGYSGRHVPHGWRSSFSTIMNGVAERSKLDPGFKSFDRLIIDLMLAHETSGLSSDELTYNRSAFMERRRELAQDWADMLLDGALPVARLLDGPRR